MALKFTKRFYPKEFVANAAVKSWNLLSAVLSPHLLSKNLMSFWRGVLSYSFYGAQLIYKTSESFIMKVGSAIFEKLAIYKVFRLRERYLLTKGNKLRLRYVSASLLSGAVALYAVFSLPSSPVTLDWPQGDHRASEMAAIDSAAGEAAGELLQSHSSRGIRMASAAIQKPKMPLRENLEIGRGDTVSGVLESAGLSSADAYNVVKALSKHYDLRKVRPGQKIEVNYNREGRDSRSFKNLVMNIDPVKNVHVKKDGEEDFVSEIEEKELVKRTYAYNTEIETSLYGSAARAGIPPQVIAEMIRIYSWNVDFQRDTRRGDKIEVLYEAMETEDGSFARYGDVLYANLSVSGKDVPIYRYEMKDGRVDYFEPDGYSIRKTLMKTPVDGARLSSGYGMRRHPVLGYNKMHKGIDFAAPTGTPIYAAGDGTIEFKGRKGGYGNYIRIRHNSKLKTAYAHMSKFGRGMGTGKRVKQGDVIGYIGTTGRSTGPHLHYEVHVNGKQVNPRSVDLPTGEQLLGEEMKRFKGLMAALKQQYAALSKGLKFAGKEKSSHIH